MACKSTEKKKKKKKTRFIGYRPESDLYDLSVESDFDLRTYDVRMTEQLILRAEVFLSQ
jgi:hypothetical protein